ncbi:MAG: T9SS C-terminal target domain-containing protein [Bacteroidetes bacterium]|nr:MAG: T9SS C-terminal target domain-containing protein [Bacteroidota bacterium]
MKKVLSLKLARYALLFTLCLLVMPTKTLLGGNFDSFVEVVTINGVNYDVKGSESGNAFSGDLGSFPEGSTLSFNGGYAKTFKESRNTCVANVCAGSIQWMVSGRGSSSGSAMLVYDNVFGDQSTNFCSIDQRWNASDNSNILAGLAIGSYTLTVTFTIPGDSNSNSGCDETKTNSASMTFTVTSAMPVSWLAIELTPRSTAHHLTFTTAAESGNDYFEIQRSLNSKSWIKLGIVRGAGTTDQQQTYTFVDEQPAFGTNYYRVKQVDYDGSYSYSPVVHGVWNEKKALLQIYPNPVQDRVFVRGVSEGSIIRIFDLQGRLLHTQAWSTHGVSISNLLAGLYQLQISDATGVTHTSHLLVK